MTRANVEPTLCPSAAAGLSLIELLVVLAVAAAVVGYALPGLQTSVANTRQTTVANRFVASVLLARSVAITKGTLAVICPSLNQQICSEDSDWNHGWIVIEADEGHTTGNTPSGRVMRVEAAPVSVTMHVNRALFRFRPRGKRATNGTVVVCHPLAVRPKAVIVSYNGRPRSSDVLADGSQIECPTS